MKRKELDNNFDNKILTQVDNNENEFNSWMSTGLMPIDSKDVSDYTTRRSQFAERLKILSDNTKSALKDFGDSISVNMSGQLKNPNKILVASQIESFVSSVEKACPENHWFIPVSARGKSNQSEPGEYKRYNQKFSELIYLAPVIQSFLSHNS